MGTEKVQPFDSLTAVYNVLTWTGLYKLLDKPKNKYKWIFHQIYRVFAFLIVIEFNTAHILFIIQKRDSLNDVFDSFMIEIPQINLFVKHVTLNWNMRRIDRINNLLKNPIFAAYTEKDEEMLMNNKRNMHRLMHIMNLSIALIGFLWPASHFFRRYQDPTAVPTTYVPFEINTWERFTYAVLLEVVPLFCIGCGHLSLDCLVATYYAQAEVQLKIIKYNLEHLFDTNCAYAYGKDYCRYMGGEDEDLRKRFVHYVKRYEAVVWYTTEIGDVFNFSMTLQFATSTTALCVVTYRMSSISVTSVQFAFLTLLLIILLSEVFIYCYFGNMVQYESKSLMDSVYLSDWLSASPQFRRVLLIAMLLWSRTLTPKVSKFIPLSLNTYVLILRGAYSLYAVLTTKE